MDWHQWHQGYQGGALSERLVLVQDQLRQAIAATRPGPIMIISFCAGQGHDVVGVLEDSPRRAELRARLVEWDERNVAEAQQRIEAAGLDGIEARQGDAGITDVYAGATPAQILLLCGVFGSLTDADIDSTVAALPRLCDAHAQVIWTAHRTAPGLYARVEEAFGHHGFVRLWADPDDRFGVTRHQLIAEAQPSGPGSACSPSPTNRP